MTLVLRYAARSDVGLVRSNNEDSVYAGARLLALADGMGGHAAGEVASQLVIAALAHLDDDEPGGDLLASLDSAVHSGNSAIAAQVEMEPDLEGMGTTLTAILFAGNRIGMVHIGDSRGYLLRDGELTQITKDDTFVQTLVDEGRITKEEAHSHPQRSLIMRALTGHEVEPTLTMREVRLGELGPRIENDPAFPERINVNVATVVDGVVKLRTFERGAGETLACGTGACATAVAAIVGKKASSPVRVEMTGGALTISWAPGEPIRMRGAATHVFEGDLDLDALA